MSELVESWTWSESSPGYFYNIPTDWCWGHIPHTQWTLDTTIHLLLFFVIHTRDSKSTVKWKANKVAPVTHPWCIGPHHTGTPIQGLSPLVQGPSSLLVTSGGQDRRPVQTCSLEEPPPPTCVDIWWLMKHVQFRAGGTHPNGKISGT